MLEVVTPATIRAISVAEVIDFCRLPDATEGALLEALIDAAAAQAETSAGRTLLTTTYDLKLGAFPTVIRLPLPPVQSVTSVAYYDQGNTLTTLTVTTDYLAYAGSRQGMVYLPDGRAWPSTYRRPDAVIVRYVAGWTAAASVPACIRAWLLSAVETLYENREQVVTGTIATALPRQFCEGLLDPERIVPYC